MDNHGGLSLPNHVHGIIAIVGDSPRAVPNGAIQIPSSCDTLYLIVDRWSIIYKNSTRTIFHPRGCDAY